ncbi:MAG: hypothetical protein NTX42_13065 [Methanothrix sp.]|nr:hypothetical protein [Methanothrix sp.]
MDDFADRYGSHFVKLVDSGASGKVFEFDQVLLMPTAAGYRALVEQALGRDHAQDNEISIEEMV